MLLVEFSCFLTYLKIRKLKGYRKPGHPSNRKGGCCQGRRDPLALGAIPLQRGQGGVEVEGHPKGRLEVWKHLRCSFGKGQGKA